MSQWFKQRRAKRDDSLLITIIDWETKTFQLSHEPAKIMKRQRAKIEARNQAMAEMLFALLEAAKYEYIWVREARFNNLCLSGANGFLSGRSLANGA